MFGFVNTMDSKLHGEESIDDSTPWVAASDGDLDLLKKSLLTLRLNAGATDHNGYTLIHAAASYSQLEIIKWIISQESCDINAKDSDGDTPLHHCDDVESAEILINAGANCNLVNNDGLTALQVKESNLIELEAEDDDSDDDDDDEATRLKQLISFLKSLSDEMAS